ncbi:MAG: aminotransferase class I/II-fold pyridoxal phosphate-dependent enzyme [Bacillota bacterium]|nr:aminotransferase class I/II-fold pyridoxal phosphate-dependent enzyme [Bacillota bacterium]
MQLSSRLGDMKPGVFHALFERRTQLLACNRTIYDLSVGTPAFLPDAHIVHALSEAAADPRQYGYAMAELPELKAAIRSYYADRFGVALSDSEVTSVHGTQEGMAHICWAICDPGDVVLVPDPGYPIFTDGPQLCGANVVTYPLFKEKGYILDFADLSPELCERARVLVVSYPLNPVCARADAAFYRELILFAKKYQITVIHDAAYSDIAFGDEPYPSFLSFPGAMDVGVEFYSLSKTYNFTGARLAFLLGNQRIVQALATIRSQIDYGIFLPIQRAAIAALTGDQSGVKARCQAYQEMAAQLTSGLVACGWPVQASQGTMFLWSGLPYGYRNSLDFTLDLMEETGVIATPGSAFGARGEGHVRFALRTDPSELDKVVAAIAAKREKLEKLAQAAGEEPL